MVEKQAEKEKLAVAGPGWKSPAFDIIPGGANSTTGVGSTAARTGGQTSSSPTTSPTTATTNPTGHHGIGHSTGAGNSGFVQPTGNGNGHGHFTNNLVNKVEGYNTTHDSTLSPSQQQGAGYSSTPIASQHAGGTGTLGDAMPRLGQNQGTTL